MGSICGIISGDMEHMIFGEPRIINSNGKNKECTVDEDNAQSYG